MQAQQRVLNSMEIDKLKDKIKDIRIAMMITQEPDGTMWFFAYDNSNKVAEIQQNQRIALGFSDPRSEVYVSTSGYAEVVKDQAKINELWSDFLKT